MAFMTKGDVATWAVSMDCSRAHRLQVLPSDSASLCMVRHSMNICDATLQIAHAYADQLEVSKPCSTLPL